MVAVLAVLALAAIVAGEMAVWGKNVAPTIFAINFQTMIQKLSNNGFRHWQGLKIV